jgi:hypothetical protein
MDEVRKLVSLALDERQKANIKVRQPLSKLEVKKLEIGKEYIELIKGEVNVKEVIANGELGVEVRLDTALTPELEEEGKVREVIRQIQDWRKEKGLKPGEFADYTLTENSELLLKHQAEIESATTVKLIKS